MKIIRKSNFDYDDNRGNQRAVAANIEYKLEAKIMCDALNERSGEHSDDYFEVVPDDYVLPPDWQP